MKDLLTISILRKFTPHNTCLHQLQSFSLAIRIKNISKFYIIQKMASSLIKNVSKNHPNKLINQFTSQY